LGPRKGLRTVPMAACGTSPRVSTISPGCCKPSSSVHPSKHAWGAAASGLIPRLPPLRPDHFVIVLFLPSCLLASGFMLHLARVIGRATGSVKRGACALGVVACFLGIWGALETRNIVNWGTQIADETDMLAVAWIQANTPPDARFWMNTAPWQGRIYRPVDGASWIPALTGRWTLLPSIHYGAGGQDVISGINAYAEPASRLKTCTSEFWRLVEDAKITHIYVKAGQGSLGPSALAKCQQGPDGLRPVLLHSAGGVQIYGLLPGGKADPSIDG